MIQYLSKIMHHQSSNHEEYKQILSSIGHDLSKPTNITISYLIPENLGNMTYPKHIKFYQIHKNDKFFTESEHHPHIDANYGSAFVDLEKKQIHETLTYLFYELKTWINTYSSNNNLSIAWWLDYGTLLGSWREKNIIRWDDDGDLGIFHKDLMKLPQKYEQDKWVFIRNPNINEYIYDGANTVVARFISKENGVFIDLFSYSMIDIDLNKRYVYNSWSMNNFRYWQFYDDLMPINGSAVFLNQTKIRFNQPRKPKKWLVNEYGSLEPPREKVWIYDENHNFSFGYYDDYEFYTHYPDYPI